MKTTSCEKCRKKIYKEAEKDYLKHQYAWFKDSALSFAIYSTVAVIAVMHRRKRSKRYIRKLFKDLCLIYDYPKVFGKQLDMVELMKQFEKEYGLDFSKITVHYESEKEFIKSAKKGDF